MSNLNIQTINLDDLTADPTTPLDGYIWHRSDIDEIRGRINGVTVTIYPAVDTTPTHKSGVVISTGFTGEVASVTFGTTFADTNYAIVLTAQTASTEDMVVCTYENKATTGFDIRISSSANKPDVTWVAVAYSNS